MKWTRVLASLVALLLPGSATFAQTPGTGRVTGRVIQASADAPISDVTVSITGTRLGALTGADGATPSPASPPAATRSSRAASASRPRPTP